jgi:hypothetical protein
MKLLYKIFFYVFGERIIFSYSSQPLPNNQHLNAYQYIPIRACFFTWGKRRGVPDGQNYGWVEGWHYLRAAWRFAKLKMQQIHI